MKHEKPIINSKRFILPEKWYIQGPLDIHKDVLIFCNSNINKLWIGKSKRAYCNNACVYDTPPEEYIKITVDQFRKAGLGNSILAWLSRVKDNDMRQKLLNNYDENFNKVVKSVYSFRDALNHAFSWRKSPEGCYYWRNLHENQPTLYTEKEILYDQLTIKNERNNAKTTENNIKGNKIVFRTTTTISRGQTIKGNSRSGQKKRITTRVGHLSYSRISG